MVIIIQARTGSARLPNKVMEKITDDKTMLEIVYNNCAGTGAHTIVACPKGDKVAEFCKEKKMNFYQGDELDLVSRYYHCAKSVNAKHIARITSDCPLLPVSTLLVMISHAFNSNFDFITNLPCPDGYDIEIMSLKALEYIYNNAPSDRREHVTDWFKEQHVNIPSKMFSVLKYREPYLLKWFPKMSVDTQEDLERVRKIYEEIELESKSK